MDQIILSFDWTYEQGTDQLCQIKNNDLVWVVRNQKTESEICLSNKICQGVVYKMTFKKIQILVEDSDNIDLPSEDQLCGVIKSGDNVNFERIQKFIKDLKGLRETSSIFTSFYDKIFEDDFIRNKNDWVSMENSIEKIEQLNPYQNLAI